MEKFLEKYFKKDEKVIVWCSAWPDSMFLVYKILETKFAKNLVICYFNHNLREEAFEEERFLEDLAKEKWFQIEIWDAKIKELKEKFYKSISLEELARQKRYEFFNAILNIYNSDKILLAHHLDDKIETFFFNLVRGSKISWLVNMKEKSWVILRPLLNISKKEILEFLEKNNLPYKIDKTNFENDFARNKLRNLIIPKFSEINEKYKQNISNFMDYLDEIKDLLDLEVKNFLEKFDWKYFLIEDFNSLPNLIQKEVIRYIFFISNWNSTIWLTSKNIDQDIKFINWKNNKTKKEIKQMKLNKDNKKILY